MDGGLDSGVYRLAASGTVVDSGALYAAIKGNTLYLAAPVLTGSFDQFIFVSKTTGKITAAPSSKAGTVAFDTGKDPFLAMSATDGVTVWTNGGASSKGIADKLPGGYMEGTIDLVQAFGSVPKTLYISFAAYAPGAGGALDRTKQAPSGKGDGNLDAAEVIAVPTATLHNEGFTGTPAVLEPKLPVRGSRG
jgi:hypothetical protein